MKPIDYVPLLFAVAVVVSRTNAQWVQMGLSDRAIGHTALGSSGLFAVTSDSGSVYRSTDGGVNWLQIVQSGAYVISGPDHWTAGRVAVAPNGKVYVARMGWGQDSLYCSADGGNIWSNITPPIAGWGMNVAVAPTGKVYCGFYSPGGVTQWYHTWFAASTDDGISWKFHDTGPDSLGGVAFAFNGRRVTTSGWWYVNIPPPPPILFHNYYLSISFDDGQTWTYRYSYYAEVFAFCATGSIMAGGEWGGGGVLSADSGASWQQISSIVPSALLALPVSSVLFGTDTTGIYLFSDNGDSMKTLNEGLTDLHIHTFALDGAGYVYVGTDNGIWRRPVSELVVSVNRMEERLPQEFALAQNYPNPFNPTTKIRYQISEFRYLKLTVYDLLGREVAVLVNENKPPGSYEVKFDAAGLSSGVYFYRIQAGDFTQTKRLLLLK